MNIMRVRGSARAVAVIAAMAVVAAGAGSGVTAMAAPGPKAPGPKATGPKAPGPKAKPEPTKLSISAKVIAHHRHHAVDIVGMLTADDMGVANEPVELVARSGVMPRWHIVMVRLTGAGGTITFAVAPAAKTQYELIFTGDAHLKASESNVITLRPVR